MIHLRITKLVAVSCAAVFMQSMPTLAADADSDGREDFVDNCISAGNPSSIALWDADEDGYGNWCDPDYDNNGSVTSTDFGVFLTVFGTSPGLPPIEQDHDNDGTIGSSDFARFSSLFGLSPGPSGLACAGSTPCKPESLALRDSPSFGPGGTILDLTNRFSAPEPIRRPDTTGWAEYSDFRDDTCSSDDTTIDAIVAQANSADDQVVYLPDDCLVKIILRPNPGSSADKLLGVSSGINRDNIWIGCHPSADPDLCGFDADLGAPTGSDPEWRWNLAEVESGGPLQQYPFDIGLARTTAISGETCTWTGGFAIGTKRIALSGCGAMTDWGPGDIVRLDSSGDPNAGGDWDWMTRITCVDGPVDGTSDRIGPQCDELTDDGNPNADIAQIQIRDALPKNYDGSYYWGAESGHTVELLERVGASRGGVGTESNNVTENFWMEGVNFHWQHDELFSASAPYVKFRDAFDSGILSSTFHDCTGACVSFGGTGNNASGILIEGSDFLDDVWDNNCWSELKGVTATNPVRVTVLDACQNGDAYVEFSEDVAEPALAGKKFIKGSTTDNLDGTASFDLSGVDGTTGGAGSGGAYLTTAGGIVAQHDAFAMSLSYCNYYASNIQWVNNALIATRSGPLWQSGCAGHVMAFNYIKNGTEMAGSRGGFSHGNGGAPGAHIEGNDFDLPMTTLANSNPQQGEGTNVTFYKNRGRDYGTINWPPGSLTSSVQGGVSGALLVAEQPDQDGASNEDWNIILNSFTDVSGATSLIDCTDNGGNSACGDSAPYMTHSLAWLRNRATNSGANIDDNFDQSTTPNPTTILDVDGSNIYESQTVPSAWAGEIGHEPTSLFYDVKPWFWCDEACVFGEIGAYHDDLSGSLCKLPAQIRHEAATCTLP